MTQPVFNHQLFAIQDQTGNFVDNRCVYYCKVDKEWRYLSYNHFTNMVTLSTTYQRAEKVLQQIIDLCKKAGIDKRFEIVPVSI